MWNRILKLDRGKTFKGHAVELVYTDTEIILNHSYFNNSLIETYNTTKNITTSDYHYYPFTKIPIWYKDLEKRLQTLNLPNKVTIERGNYSSIFYIGNHITFSYSKQNNGISFSNHYQNINRFHKMRFMYSILRKNLKKLSDEDLLSFEIKNDHPYEQVLILPENMFDE